MTEPIDKNVLGLKIKQIREQNGLTMEEFIERLDGKSGKNRSGTVNNWESGKNSPNKKRLKKIAELGNVSVDYLLHGKIYLHSYNKDFQRLLQILSDNYLDEWDQKTVVETMQGLSDIMESDSRDQAMYSNWFERLGSFIKKYKDLTEQERAHKKENLLNELSELIDKTDKK